MDVIYTFDDYKDDTNSRLTWPKRTGKSTTYTQWLIYHYQLYHDEPYIDEEPNTVGPAFVNHGRWLWLCPACQTSVQVCSGTQGGTERIFCPACYSQRVVTPQFPDNREEIEEELLRQPGYRWNAPFRNWEPGWSMAYLRERTARAQEQMAQGVRFVRSASIGIPRTWAVGEVLTASNMNTFIREIQRDLRGDNGAIELVHGVRPGSFTTAQLNALTGTPEGTMFYDSTEEAIKLQQASGNPVPVGLLRHESQLFSLHSRDTVVTHNMGVEPVLFQLLIERVSTTAHNGWNIGDRIYMTGTFTASNSAKDLQMYDIGTTSYSIFSFNASVRILRKDLTTLSDFATTVDNDPNDPVSGGWGARIVAFG